MTTRLDKYFVCIDCQYDAGWVYNPLTYIKAWIHEWKCHGR